MPPEFLVDEKYKFFCFANFTFSHFFAKTKNCSFFTLTLCSFWGVWLIAISFGIYAVSNVCNQLQKHGSQPCTLSHARGFQNLLRPKKRPIFSFFCVFVFLWSRGVWSRVLQDDEPWPQACSIRKYCTSTLSVLAVDNIELVKKIRFSSKLRENSCLRHLHPNHTRGADSSETSYH